jgi:hypothetical protein
MIRNKVITTVIGYILLAPAVLSVIISVLNIIPGAYQIMPNSLRLFQFYNYGYKYSDGFGSGLPIYIGILAIVGAYLIKENNN